MDYADKISLALEGLVPIAFLERVHRRCCKDSLHPTVEELWPEDWEREEVVETLVMADTLAAGASTPKEHEKRAKALSAVAKALVILSLAPGGVCFLGIRYAFKNGAFVTGPATAAPASISGAEALKVEREGLRDALRMAEDALKPTRDRLASVQLAIWQAETGLQIGDDALLGDLRGKVLRFDEIDGRGVPVLQPYTKEGVLSNGPVRIDRKREARKA